MHPDRRPKVWNKRDPHVPADAVYVGRPTPWGNHFIIGVHGTRAEVIERYRAWIWAPENGRVRRMARNQLAERDLVCWCAPKPCHADVLVEVANRGLA